FPTRRSRSRPLRLTEWLPSALAELVFNRPERDVQFFGWTHPAFKTHPLTCPALDNNVIFMAAADSVDPPR
ncbi:MAG: hypothetical protein AAFO91_00170, partial [Bacteroidota bacterium]